jgi:dihydrofolate reductase
MIRHIAAIDSRLGLAKDGGLPWSLPVDTAYYKGLVKTDGGIVLVGTGTYRTMAKPLPGLTNFVLSRDQTFQAPDCMVVHDVEAFLRRHPDVWIIGGGQVFAATLQWAEELYLTEIDADFDCDIFYPDFRQQFILAKQGDVQHEIGLAYRFNVYQPRT